MGQVLHGCATTTEAIRRAIQNSQESLRALAKRYGINQKTVAKWKQRETVADLPTGPREAKSTVLSIEEEAIIVAIRLPCRRCSRNGFTRSPERHTEGDNMKFVSAAALALIGCLVGFNSASAQGAAMKTTPTTKILAIGTINPGFEQSQVVAVLPEEVRETVDVYLDGKIE